MMKEIQNDKKKTKTEAQKGFMDHFLDLLISFGSHSYVALKCPQID